MTSKQIFLLLLSVLLSSNLIDCVKVSTLRKRRWDNNGDMSENFRGVAGVDYPDLKSIPTTSFRCEDQIYEGGLYADVETQCQVYHVCHEGRKDSFLCGKGTIFNQQILACDYWYSADCESAPNYYFMNSQIGNDNSRDGYDYQGKPDAYGYSHGGGDLASYNVKHNQQSCRCVRSSHSNPWEFPAGNVLNNGDK